MADRIQELQQQRTGLINEQRQILDTAEGENRNLTSDEQTDYDSLSGQIDTLDGRIERLTVDRERQRAELEADGRGRGLGVRRGDAAAVLGPEDSFRDWLRASGGLELGSLGREVSDDDFSLVRMLRAKLNPSFRGELTDDEARALGEGTDATGGVLVPTILSANVIDRLRARSVCIQAGARIVPMDSDETTLARINGGSEANWKSENAAISESNQTWERVTLKAKTAVVLQRLSVELFEDMSPRGEQMIRNEIAQALALKLDLAALEGSGVDPEPLGVAGTAGVNQVSMGVDGATPTEFDPIVQAVFAVMKANGPDPTAVILHPREGETFALLKDTTGQPLRKPEAIANLPFLFSSQIKTDQAQGVNNDASNGYVGAFPEMLIGVRPVLTLRITSLRERYADNLQIGMLAYLRADVALAHGASFTKIIGIRNA